MTPTQRPASTFPPRTAPYEERFWGRVDRRSEDECWPWMGWINESGYGEFSTRGGSPCDSRLAHRIAYWYLRGPIPEGLVLDHLCRNRWCVNPSHTEPVTDAENLRRSPLILKDECVNGHPYTEGSYYMDRGRRACKECKRAQVAKYDKRTGRSTARFVCEFCGRDLNATGRSKHIRAAHPEHYTPRKRFAGISDEERERKLALQRERRRRARAARLREQGGE